MAPFMCNGGDTADIEACTRRDGADDNGRRRFQ
jgi:hypothetical protein